MKNIEELAKEISYLNSTEINRLSEALLEYNINATIYHFGIIPSIGIVSDVEKFEVYMVDSGQAKLLVVKLIKETFGLGLRDAKYCVDNIPCLLAENFTYNDAKKIKRDFEEIGATISINDSNS